MYPHRGREPWRVHPDSDADERRAANDNHLFKRICEAAARCDCCWFVWLGLVDIVRDRVVPVAAAGYEADYLRGIRVDVSATAYGRGPVGSAARENSIWIIEDIESDVRMAPWREEALLRAYHSVAAFPIRDGERVVAVLAVYSTASFDADALERFVRLAHVASRILRTRTTDAGNERREAATMSIESRRGFRALDPAKLREIASKGGKAAHARGTAHEFGPEEARKAAARRGRRLRGDGERAAREGRLEESRPEDAPLDRAGEDDEDEPDTLRSPGSGPEPSS